jgi:membrane protease YdiL (CAAX protease family)
MSTQQMPKGDVPRGRRWSGRQRAWFTAVAIAALLTLLSELGRRHYAAHTLGGRILGAVFGGAVLALVLRALIYVVVPAWRERRPARRSRSRNPERGLTAKRPWGPGYAFGALVAVWVMLAAIGFALQATDVVNLPLGVGALIVEGLFLIALVPLRRRYGVHRADIGLRLSSGPRAVGLVIVALIATAVLSGIYLAAVHPSRPAGSFEGLGRHSAVVIAIACFASIIAAPFAEEIFFRGLLYGGLRNRLPVVPAALIVAVVFGLGHTQYPLLERPVMAIFGFIACLLYERTRSLLPSMGLHSLHNALAVTVALSAPAWLVLAAYSGLGLVVSAPAGYRALRRGTARGGAPTAEARA